MKVNSFEKLFIILLSDIYFFENHLLEAIPEMSRKAQSRELKEALQDHLKETKQQVHRLDRIFKILGDEPLHIDWTTNLRSLFDKASRFLEQNEASPVLDATIIAIAQRVEHFEIATYGTLKEYARVLDYDEIRSILDETLKEEDHADTVLNKLAKGGFFTSGINIKAAQK